MNRPHERRGDHHRAQANDAGAAAGGAVARETYPLRGLASEGAEEIVGRALRGVPGVVAHSVRIADALVEVTYDASVTTWDAIRDRLHRAGLTHPDRDAGAHGPEGDAARPGVESAE